MLKRTVSASVLSCLLVLTLSTKGHIVTAGAFDFVRAPTETSSATAEPNDAASSPKKGGGGFLNSLTAPFRAIGKLFNGGKKKERQASNKKDVKFESTPVMRVTQGTAEVKTSIPKSEWEPFEIRLKKGRELVTAGDIDGAIAELTLAASLNPKSSEANKLLGIAYESKRQPDRAIKAFEAAVKADENNADNLNNLGYMLFKKGDYERASQYLKRAAKISPKNARVWNNLALVQCQRGKFDEAYVSFVNAVGEFNANRNIAVQLLRFGHGKEAIKHLERARQIEPTSAEVLTRLVTLYESMGRPEDAEGARRSLAGLKSFADANP
jgi:Flp pilus assembly protein TadD